MPFLQTCQEVVFDCSPGDDLDYGLFIPGDKWRPLPPEEDEDLSPIDEDELRRLEEEAQREQEEAMAALLVKDELKDKFYETSGGADSISPDQAGEMGREMGFAPSQQDIRELNEKCGGKVTFEDLKTFLVSSAHPEDQPDFLLEFFRHFDTSRTGKLSKKQIKNLLQNFGEPLTDAEMEALFKSCGVSDPVEYEKMVEKMLEKK